MPINPQVQALLDEFSKQGLPPFDQMSVTQARLVALSFRDLQGEPENIGEIRDIVVPGPAGSLPVRVYHPSPGKSLPLVVYYHGGGWVIGDLEIVDKPCRALANASQCVVASVNYRLSPETKFPGPAEDCYAATKWLAEHARDIGADSRFVAVAGDSAGGNLAAATALRLRDEGGPMLQGQLLIYPVTDYYTPGTRSYRDNAEGYGLTRDTMIWFWDHYLADAADAADPYASPLRAVTLAGLPPALVVTAEFDPLCDEGEDYAARLRAAGVPVQLSRWDGMNHGFFFWVGIVDKAGAAMAESCAWLRGIFAG